MAEQTTNSSPVPPYVPYRSFRNFIDSLKQGIPARIDRSVMGTMSGALQSQLTAAMRYLELISMNNHPTTLLPRLVNSEGPERAKVMREIVAKSYAFLFSGFDLKTATPRMVEEQFGHAGASGGTVDKCVNFFLAAAKEAGVELSPHLKNPRANRAPRPRTSRSFRLVDANSADDDFRENGAPADTGNVSWSQMLLSKFPSFDPSWPDDVKAKWFDAFDKLMKQGSGPADMR